MVKEKLRKIKIFFNKLIIINKFNKITNQYNLPFAELEFKKRNVVFIVPGGATLKKNLGVFTVFRNFIDPNAEDKYAKSNIKICGYNIQIKENTNLKYMLATFYHEMGHFVNFVLGKNAEELFKTPKESDKLADQWAENHMKSYNKIREKMYKEFDYNPPYEPQ